MQSRPSWTNYFLGLSHIVAQRSHDIHTKHGCIITDSSNRILGVGYNGFPRGLDDTKLPTNRPDKYHWMIHAEKNALSNCVVRPDNGIAYVTGQSCCDCTMALWQEGVTKIVMSNKHGTILFDDEENKRFNLFVEMSNIKILKIDTDLSWLRDTCGVL